MESSAGQATSGICAAFQSSPPTECLEKARKWRGKETAKWGSGKVGKQGCRRAGKREREKKGSRKVHCREEGKQGN